MHMRYHQLIESLMPATYQVSSSRLHGTHRTYASSWKPNHGNQPQYHICDVHLFDVFRLGRTPSYGIQTSHDVRRTDPHRNVDLQQRSRVFHCRVRPLSLRAWVVVLRCDHIHSFLANMVAVVGVHALPISMTLLMPPSGVPHNQAKRSHVHHCNCARSRRIRFSIVVIYRIPREIFLHRIRVKVALCSTCKSQSCHECQLAIGRCRSVVPESALYSVQVEGLLRWSPECHAG